MQSGLFPPQPFVQPSLPPPVIQPSMSMLTASAPSVFIQSLALPKPSIQARRGPVAGQDGNWVCGSCANVNYPSRDMCNRCQKPRSVGQTVAVGTMAINQQSAAAINQQPTKYNSFNTNKLTFCRRAPVAGCNGAWQCRECSNVNYAWRDECNRCKAVKEQESTTEQ